MFETNYHPWEATAALDFFSFRHELEWKDRVYADISYLKISDNSSRLIRMELVNNTDIDQNLTMNFMASVHFPSLREYQPDTPLYHAEVVLPPAGVWIDAIDYSQIHFTRKTPQDNLVYNGMLRGEIRADGLVSGSGIGRGFGKGKGDKIRFEIADLKVPDNDVVFRCRIGKDEKVRVLLSGVLNDTIAMTGTGAFELLFLPLHQKGDKNTSLTITSPGGAEIQWDGIAIVPRGSSPQLKFGDHQWFFFKAMLDMGEADFAYRIAKTALETCKRETEATYNCMEHFIIDTGRGAGWHQFGALSSPVVNWFSTYYKKDIITTGYDFWIREKKFAPDHSSLQARLIRTEKKDGYSAVIVTMQEDREYQVKVNGKAVSYDMPHNGCLVIRVPNRSKEVSLEIL